MRILIVEDEVQLADVIARFLRREGYEVDVAHDGLTGLERAATGDYAALVLDRLLPGLDGMTVCRRLRAADVHTPVLILSALRELPERVEGLDAGADDYLGKPFALAELLARLRALTRRGDRPVVPDVLRAGAVALDRRSHRVTVGGHAVELTPREYALLEYLLHNAGQVLDRRQILERVWGIDAEPEGNVVELYVHYLRRKLEQAGAKDVIRTVRGAGYRIER